MTVSPLRGWSPVAATVPAGSTIRSVGAQAVGGTPVVSARPRSTNDDRAAQRALRELERSVLACRACDLYRDRTTPVVAQGPVDAEVMLVGSVPRRHEDLQGRPFAGASANVLDNALLDAGLPSAQVHRSSIVRCRPGDDRAPTRDEIDACLPHLEAQIALVQPKVLVTLGAAATSILLGRPVPIERVAGYRLDVLRGTTLIPTYHPTDVVRGVPQAAATLRRDLRAAKAVLDGRLRTGAQTLADLRSRQLAAR
ncbi:uracil-DNA glycosylase [Nitriliruptoraceae bacterium ZYF776]|nr:uracil-DNA glycosylase [Profundirhabdus halotolerans]